MMRRFIISYKGYARSTSIIVIMYQYVMSRCKHHNVSTHVFKRRGNNPAQLRQTDTDSCHKVVFLLYINLIFHVHACVNIDKGLLDYQIRTYLTSPFVEWILPFIKHPRTTYRKLSSTLNKYLNTSNYKFPTCFSSYAKVPDLSMFWITRVTNLWVTMCTTYNWVLNEQFEPI